MSFLPSFLEIKDGLTQKKRLIAYYTGSAYAFAHAMLNRDGSIIDPATADNQAAANSKLDQVIANTAAKSANFSVTPTVTAGAYTTGMVVGGKIEIPNASRIAGGSGLIQQVLIGKRGSNLTAAIDLYVFRDNPAAAFTDHAPMPNYGADLDKLVRIIQCDDLHPDALVQIVQSSDIATQFDLPEGSTKLYVVPVIRGSETYASTTAVTISLGILQD